MKRGERTMEQWKRSKRLGKNKTLIAIRKKKVRVGMFIHVASLKQRSSIKHILIAKKTY